MLGFCSWIAFQSVAFAIAPKTTEGPVMIRAIRPPPYDNKTALADVLEDKTLNKERIEFMPSWKVSCRKNPLKYFIMLNIAEIIQGATMQLSPPTIGL